MWRYMAKENGTDRMGGQREAVKRYTQENGPY
jgi:hypothetical protein